MTRSEHWPGRNSAVQRSPRDLSVPSTETRLRFAWTEISFDPVSVRIDDEGGVVIRSVHWPQTRPTVVPAARAQGRGVKCFDGRCAGGRKADVQARLFVRRNGMLG